MVLGVGALSSLPDRLAVVAPLDRLALLGAKRAKQELREVDRGVWAFRGYWQDSARSGVSSDVMHELFGSGFICRLDETRVGITKAGEQALSRSIEVAIDAASKWFKLRG
jgi:hypothetical protein